MGKKTQFSVIFLCAEKLFLNTWFKVVDDKPIWCFVEQNNFAHLEKKQNENG